MSLLKYALSKKGMPVLSSPTSSSGRASPSFSPSPLSIPSPLSPSRAPPSPSTLSIPSPLWNVPSPSPSRHMREILNQTEDKCEWGAGPTSAIIMSCKFPEPVKEADGNQYIYLESGHMLYRSEKHFGKTPKWFNTTNIGESSKNHMWFANTPEHVQVFGGTHVLMYKVIRPIKLLFIRNLTKEKHVKDGNQYYREKYTDDVKDLIVDGYAGCNECECMLTKSGLLSLTQRPVEIKDLSKYVSGGSRRRQHKRRRTTRKHK